MVVKYFLRPLLINLTINALALFGVVYLLPDRLVIEGGLAAYVLAAIVIGLLNYLVKPLLKLMSIPFIVTTLGLFLILINGIIIFLTEYIVSTFAGGTISMSVLGGFFSYLIIALIFGVLNYLITLILKK